MVNTFTEALSLQLREKDSMKSKMSPTEVAGIQHLAITGEINFSDLGFSMSSQGLGDHFTVDHPVNGIIDSATLEIDTGLDASSVSRSTSAGANIANNGAFETARFIAGISAEYPAWLGVGTGSQIMGRDVSGLNEEVGSRVPVVWTWGTASSKLLTYSARVQQYDASKNFTEFGIFNSSSGGELFFYRTFSSVTNTTDGFNDFTGSVLLSNDAPLMDDGLFQVRDWFTGTSSVVVPSSVVFGSASISVTDTTFSGVDGPVYTSSASVITSSLNRATVEGLIPTSGATGSTLRNVGLLDSDDNLWCYFGIAPVSKTGLFEVDALMSVRIL